MMVKRTKMYMVEVVYEIRNGNQTGKKVCKLVYSQPYTSLKRAYNTKSKMEKGYTFAKYRVVEVIWRTPNKKDTSLLTLYEM